MIIGGLQKLTLIDYPEKLACSIFLHGCNLRCGFCHNPSLVTGPVAVNLSEKEILDFLEARHKYLDGACITGGEPLMSIEEDFLRKIKNLGYAIKIDTNGCFPERLKELIDKQLVDYVAMDIKAPKEDYNKVAGVKVDISKIEESIRLISRLESYEFRTTIAGKLNNAKEIKKLAEWLKQIVGKKPKRYYLQAFKNSGSFVDQAFKTEQDVGREELLKLKEVVKDYFEEVCVRA